jgi:hypothetical protein
MKTSELWRQWKMDCDMIIARPFAPSLRIVRSSYSTLHYATDRELVQRPARIIEKERIENGNAA